MPPRAQIDSSLRAALEVVARAPNTRRLSGELRRTLGTALPFGEALMLRGDRDGSFAVIATTIPALRGGTLPALSPLADRGAGRPYLLASSAFGAWFLQRAAGENRSAELLVIPFILERRSYLAVLTPPEGEPFDRSHLNAAEHFLPLAAPAPAKAPTDARLLLAEDNRINQLVAMELLKRSKYRIDAVANGAEAIEAVKTRPYDLVLMDIQMPEMDGFEASAAIRKLPGARGRVPIIALTAYAMEGDRERCLAAGMNDFVTKPVRRDELLAVVERWLEPGEGASRAPARAARERDAPLFDPKVLAQLEADVDPTMVHELVARFVAELPVRFGRLEAAIRRNDIKALGDEAHTLSSSAGTFGALKLQQQLTAVEIACRGGKANEAEALAETLPALVERTRIALAERHGAAA